MLPFLARGQTITTVAGNGVPGYSGDGGPALTASLYDIDGVALDTSGNLYIDDWANQRVRRVDATTQTITTVAGNGIVGFSGDGGLAILARFNDIRGLDLDSQGDLFIADRGNTRVRKVEAATGLVRTIAGNGTPAFTGDGGPATAASLRFPGGIAVDGPGNIYIADTYNNRVRRVDASTGIITTVAGNGVYGFSGDGGNATLCELQFPYDVAVDAQENIFIADTWNHRIRRVDNATGLITTVAGNGFAGFGGDGGAAPSASLNYPAGVIVAPTGELFIADPGNQRVRKVDGSTGLITTFAGTGTAFFSGDGGPALSADLNRPFSLCLDGNGDLYISDANNHRVRKVVAVPIPTATQTPTLIPSPTPTPTASATPSGTPTFTRTPVGTSTPTVTPTPVCETHVWPDPFDPAYAVGGLLKISCVPPFATVSLFTLSGEEVRTLREENGMAEWDGRNQKGFLVSGGVYFYVVQRGEILVQSGKLLVMPHGH